MDHLTIAQEKTFESFLGPISCKIPSAKQQIEISRRTQIYAGGLPLAPDDWDLAESMAYLDALATPPDDVAKDKAWDYDKIYDTESLTKLGKEVKEWVASFRESLRGKQKAVGA